MLGKYVGGRVPSKRCAPRYVSTAPLVQVGVEEFYEHSAPAFVTGACCTQGKESPHHTMWAQVGTNARPQNKQFWHYVYSSSQSLFCFVGRVPAIPRDHYCMHAWMYICVSALPCKSSSESKSLDGGQMLAGWCCDWSDHNNAYRVLPSRYFSAFVCMCH